MNKNNLKPSEKDINNLVQEYRRGRYNIAIKLASSIIDKFPTDQFTLRVLGVLFGITGKVNESINVNQKLIDLFPNDNVAHNNLGNSFKILGKLDEAQKSYTKAIKLKPDFAEAHNNLGVTLHELGEFDQSLKNYAKAIELKPDYVEAYNNLGLTLQELGKLDEAQKSYTKAIKLKPDFADANFNLSTLLNLKGNLKEGLKLYEWRFHKTKGITQRPRKELTWDGEESIQGKKILVYEEQGLGDIIQFYRYLFLLQNKGADVIFKVKKNLHHLLTGSNKKIQIIDSYLENIKIDFEIPLMSLPFLLKTDIDSIPSLTPYLTANFKKINEWAKKLKSDNFKIGICWQGSKKKIDLGRSFPLLFFKDISKIPKVQLISLYKGDEENQISNIDFDLTTLGKDFDNGTDAFIDTAAAMMNCDLIITSDTAIAHLAGALGLPVWVALKYIPEWRWMLNHSDSPWYPTMKLYRQNTFNNWNSVFSLITKDLKTIVNKKIDKTII